MNEFTPKEQAAQANFDNGKRLLHQGIHHPHYPPYLRKFYGDFTQKLHLVSEADFETQMRTRLFADNLHPELESLREESLAHMMQKDAVVLRNKKSSSYPVTDILVSQGYAGQDLAHFFMYELLAEEFGHVATNIHRSRKVASLSQATRMYPHIEQEIKYFEKRNISLSNPAIIDNGFRHTLHDEHWSYVTIPISLLLEEFRAKAIGLYTVIHVGMAQTGESFEAMEMRLAASAVKFHAAMPNETVHEKELMVLAFGSQYGWDRLMREAVFHDGTQFLDQVTRRTQNDTALLPLLLRYTRLESLVY